MKSKLLIVFMVIFSSASFCQNIQKEYLRKSRTQRTAGIVTVATGSLMIVAGLSQSSTNVGSLYRNSVLVRSDGETSKVLVYSGLAAIAGGVTLLVISSKNKKKAMTINFMPQMVPDVASGVFDSPAIPSITLKWKI